MHSADDPIVRDQEARIDRDLRDAHRPVNLSAEIVSRRGSDPGEDRLNLIAGKLLGAEVMLEDALNERRSFSEVIDLVTDEILTLDPGNAEALAIRAIANSHLYRFAEARNDAQAALLADLDHRSRWSDRVRSQLPYWREQADLFGE